MRNVVFSPESFEHYRYWQKQDEDVLDKLNRLIQECQRTPFTGTGKPEPLKGNLKGYWSRRMTQEHRLLYRVDEHNVFIVSCRFHYEK